MPVTKYGAMEVNGLDNPQAYHAIDRNEIPPQSWDTPGLKITRLRLITDPGFPFWDVSYCHGELQGVPCRVTLPFSQVPRGQVSRFIVNEAIKAGINAKRIGALEALSFLK